MIRSRRGSVAAAIGAIAFVATLIYSHRAPAFDDAFITATFARNLANGHGLTWTPGDASFYGPTSLPHTLVLAAGERIGLGSLTTSRWVGAIGWGAAHAFLFLIAVTFLSELNAAIASVWSALLLLGPRLSVGMETGPYIAVIMAALLVLNARAFRASFILSVVAMMIRPDGLVALATVTAGCWLACSGDWRERIKQVARFAVPGIVIALLAAIVSLAALGTIVPQSVVAKRSFTCEIAGCFSLKGLVDEFVGRIGRGTSAILVFLAAIGAARITGARASKALPLLGWSAAYALVFAVAKAPSSPWYYAPLAPALTTAAAFGALGPWPFRTRAVRWVGGICFAATVLLTTRSVLFRPAPLAVSGVEPERAQLTQSILADMTTRGVTSVRVLAFEVGYLGYTIPGKVIDLLGVVSPNEPTCPSGISGSTLLRRAAPDYVVVIDQPYAGTVCVAGSAELASNYTLLTKVSRDFGSYMDFYLVYRRK